MIDYDPDGTLTADPGDVAGWDGRPRVAPEPGPDDEALAARAKATIDRLMPPALPPPLTPADLAAHVHDLLARRGQQPVRTDDTRRRAEEAAAELITAWLATA